jgi:hypothetical protein
MVPFWYLQDDIAGFLQIIVPFKTGRIVQTNDKICFRRSKPAAFESFQEALIRSLKEIRQKSLMSGAPNTAAPEQAAVIPGTTSMVDFRMSSCYFVHDTGHTVDTGITAGDDGYPLTF